MGKIDRLTNIIRIVIDGPTIGGFDVAAVVDHFCTMKERKPYAKREVEKIREMEENNFVDAFFNAAVVDSSDED